MQRRAFTKGVAAALAAAPFFGNLKPNAVTITCETFEPPRKWEVEADNYGPKLSEKEKEEQMNLYWEILKAGPEGSQKVLQDALNERAFG